MESKWGEDVSHDIGSWLLLLLPERSNQCYKDPVLMSCHFLNLMHIIFPKIPFHKNIYISKDSWDMGTQVLICHILWCGPLMSLLGVSIHKLYSTISLVEAPIFAIVAWFGLQKIPIPTHFYICSYFGLTLCIVKTSSSYMWSLI